MAAPSEHGGRNDVQEKTSFTASSGLAPTHAVIAPCAHSHADFPAASFQKETSLCDRANVTVVGMLGASSTFAKPFNTQRGLLSAGPGRVLGNLSHSCGTSLPRTRPLLSKVQLTLLL